MKTKKTYKITQKRLRELFFYSVDTGRFMRLKSVNGTSIGDVVTGTKHRQGYLRMSVDGAKYAYHTLVWMYMYGDKPSSPLIHANGDKADNRIKNLMLSSRQPHPVSFM